MTPRLISATVLAVVLGFAAESAQAQARYNVHFRSPSVSGAAGSLVTLGIGLDNQPDRVTGFSFGVKHDAAKLTVQSVDIAPGLQAALGAGQSPDARFFSLDTSPDGGAGFTLGIILSADNPAIALPAGLDHHIFDAHYTLAAGSQGSSKVDITGDLGAPKVAVILDLNGKAQPPVGAVVTTSATVAVTAGPAGFIRGDANQSGRLDVTDATILLNFLFQGGSLPAGQNTRDNCVVLMNFDGSTAKVTPDVEDQGDIDLTDPLALLGYLFQRGNAPPAPFPACGQPSFPVAEAIQCKAYAGCASAGP